MTRQPARLIAEKSVQVYKRSSLNRFIDNVETLGYYALVFALYPVMRLFSIIGGKLKEKAK